MRLVAGHEGGQVREMKAKEEGFSFDALREESIGTENERSCSNTKSV